MMKRRQAGITIMETMIVLSLLLLVFAFSLSQYELFKREREYFRLQVNVDELFNAMGRYFRANCSSLTLFPKDSSAPVIVNVSDLKTGGYLVSDPLPVLSLVNSTLSDDTNYFLQFNPVMTNPDRLLKSAYDPTAPGVPIDVVTGKIVLYRAQVGVLITSSARGGYKGSMLKLKANCVGIKSGTAVEECQANHPDPPAPPPPPALPPDYYWIFDVAPSWTMANVLPANQLRRYQLMSFKQLYTQYSTTTSGMNATFARDNNIFVCGP